MAIMVMCKGLILTSCVDFIDDWSVRGQLVTQAARLGGQIGLARRVAGGICLVCTHVGLCRRAANYLPPESSPLGIR